MSQMIVWRAIQGFIGGGMIPTVFASAYTVFPRRDADHRAHDRVDCDPGADHRPDRRRLSHRCAVLALAVFINILPGIGVVGATAALIDFDKPNLKLFEQFDWWGLIFMAAFLGSLEYVLEEGQRYNWFDDETITLFAVLSAVAAVAFFVRVFAASQPIVDLKAFTNRNFALGSMFSFVLGIGLYGLTYLYPLYLARVRGYDALMIGETMFVSGIAMFVCAPIVGRMMDKVDPRIMLVFGFMTFAAGSWQMTYLTKDFDFWQIFMPQVLRGVGLMFAMVPITNLALGTLPPERLKNASGLFNLTRNLGGASDWPRSTPCSTIAWTCICAAARERSVGPSAG
jgi:DHA2 family multidrug resistance protein